MSSHTHLSSLSFDDFVGRFRTIFDHPDQAGNATGRLLAIHQGARSVAEYAVEFWTLAVDSGWNEPALQGVFCRGLNGQLWDALALRVRPRDLKVFIELTIELDKHVRERRQERAARPSTSRSSSLRKVVSSSAMLNLNGHPLTRETLRTLVLAQRNPSDQKLQPCAFFNQRFNFSLMYHPGSKNTKPDALSCQFSADLQEPDPKHSLLPAMWGLQHGRWMRGCVRRCTPRPIREVRHQIPCSSQTLPAPTS